LTKLKKHISFDQQVEGITPKAKKPSKTKGRKLKMNKSIVEKIKELSGVSGVSQWKDRYYINLRGNGGNFKGERNAKVWFKDGGELNVELGKGLCSSEWHEQLEQVKSVFSK